MKIKFNHMLKTLGFVLMVILLFSSNSFSQAFLNSADLSSFKAGELKESELIQIKQELTAKNMTPEQLGALALTRGMPANEVEVLKIRLNALAPIELVKPDQIDAEEQAKKSTIKEDDEKEIISQDVDPEIFGSEMFASKNLTFEPNTVLPPSQAYIVGSNDVLDLNVWGVQQFSYSGKVSTRGTINIPNVGEVFVGGLSLEAAENKLRSSIARIYSTVGSGSKFSINISSFRTISLVIIGARKPGNYKVSSMSTVFSALYLAGGPNQMGSYRNIELVRDGKVVQTIDLYKFLTTGDQSENVGLKDNDVIRIPAYSKRVKIEGEVKRPGIFELAENETLSTLIDYASGLTENAYTNNISVEQKTGKERKITSLNDQNYGNYTPESGDVIKIAKILDRYSNRVQIRGAVFRPGPYSLEEGMTVKSLIEQADGLVENVFYERATLIRQQENLVKEYITINLKAVMAGAETGNIALQREDELVIFFDYELLDQYDVTISGEVRKSGNYPFTQGLTLQDLVLEAEGFTDLASSRISISRIKKDTLYDANDPNRIVHFVMNFDASTAGFKLEPQDYIIVRRIEVYRIPEQIEIQGEVLYPGPYSIVGKEEKLSSFLLRAGGFTDEASAESIHIIRNNLNIPIDWNNLAKKPQKMSDIIVKPGDKIIIPKVEQTVLITGSVMMPIETTMRRNKGLRYYVRHAGGKTEKGKLRRAYVVHQNGQVIAANNVLFFKNYPKIKGGSTIIVPEKAEKSGNRTTVGEIIGYSSMLASVAGVVISIIQLK